MGKSHKPRQVKKESTLYAFSLTCRAYVPNLSYRLCHLPTCQHPEAGRTTQNHHKTFHKPLHTFTYNGASHSVSRRPDGKLPCPCGEESHSRYSYHNIRNLCSRDPHPPAGTELCSDPPPTCAPQLPRPESRAATPHEAPQDPFDAMDIDGPALAGPSCSDVRDINMEPPPDDQVPDPGKHRDPPTSTFTISSTIQS